MKTETLRRLDELFAQSPILVAGAAGANEIAAVERELGRPMEGDYRQFVERYGGAMVGSLPVFGVRASEVMGRGESVVWCTRFFRSQGWPGTVSWWVISDDGAGNPIGLDENNEIWISDHDTHSIRRIASRFEDFVLILLDNRGF